MAIGDFSEPRVQQAPLPGVRVNSDIPLEAAGGGQARAQETAAQIGLAGESERIAMEEKHRADNAATQDAYARLVQLKNSTLWDPKEGALTKRGKDSFGIIDDYVPKFQKAAGEIEKDLNNDTQRSIFHRMLDNQQTETIDTMRKHIFGEARSYEKEASDATIQTARNDAVLNFASDPSKVDHSLSLIRATLIDQAQKNGIPAEVLQRQVEDETSLVHASIVKQLVQNHQSGQAQNYLEAHKDEFNAKDLGTTEAALKQETTLGEVQKQATQLLIDSKNDPAAAITSARQSIKDPEIQEGTVRELKIRGAELNDAAQASAAAQLTSAFNMVDQTKALPDGTVMAALAPAQRKEVYAYTETVRRGQRPATDPSEYYYLRTLAGADQKKFLSKNLLDYRNSLDDQHWEEMVKLQGEMRKGNDTGTQAILDSFKSNSAVVDTTLNQAGLDTTPKGRDWKAVTQFKTMVDQEAAVMERQTGKPVDATGMQQIVDNLMVKSIKAKGFLGRDTLKPLLQYIPGDTLVPPKISDIPQIEVEKIHDYLSRTGQPITDEAVAAQYSKKMKRIVGAK